MNTPDVNAWVEGIKGAARAEEIGMMLIHRGVVRGTSRTGDPVAGMDLSVDRRRLEDAVDEAHTWPGVVAVRAWVNEGTLAVGDDIMSVLVAGDIRENVFSALQRIVTLIKNDVVSEVELPAS